MSVKGEINRIHRAISANHGRHHDNSGRVGLSRPIRFPHPKIIIEAVNKTGENLQSFTCLVIKDGADPKDMLELYYPEDDDDFELSQYCSLQGDALIDEIVHVQVGGPSLFTIAQGSTPIISGEILYPLKNEGVTKGKLGNKASGTSDLINNALGRALQGEDSDTELIYVNLGIISPEQGLTQFKFVSDEGDFIRCQYWNGEVSGDEVFKIAKPYLLRKTPFDGLTDSNDISYLYSDGSTRAAADDDGNEEVQVVVPAYRVGDIIYAMKSSFNGTSTVDDEEVNIKWLDINADGRAWAKES